MLVEKVIYENMKSRIFVSVVGLLGGLSLAACNKTEDVLSKIEYVPFQMETDGRWGMVSLDGEVFYEDEFDSLPTFAVNGRFAVKNSNGMWEIYATEKPPRKIGEEYVSVSSFGPGVALVTRGKNKGIEMIDRDGNVKCALNEVVGKSVDMAGPLYFMRGVRLYFSPFVVFGADKKVGCMDAEGRVVIPPEYSWITYSGKYLMAFKDRNFVEKYRDYIQNLFVLGEYNTEDGDTLRTCVFDRAGNRLRAFTTVGESMAGWFSDEIIYVGKSTDEKLRCELRTPDNEVLLKLPSGVSPNPACSMPGDKFVFWDENSEHYGLMNMAGDMLIRDKYGVMVAASDNLYVVARDDDDCNLVDEKDNPVGNMTFKSIGFYGDRKILVEEEENSYCFIDHAGRKTGDKTFYNVGVVSGVLSMFVESDYIDLIGLLHSLDIKKGGIGDFSLGMTAVQLVKLVDGDREPQNYVDEYAIRRSYRNKEDVPIDIVAGCPETIGHEILIDYAKWWGEGDDDYYIKQEHTGEYEYTETSVDYVALVFRDEGKLKGMSDQLFDAARSYLNTYGLRVTHDAEGELMYDSGKGNVIAVLKAKVGKGIVLYVGTGDRLRDVIKDIDGE